MKVNEFVRNYGWRHAKNVASGLIIYNDGCAEKSINLALLKRLVESKAWVDEHGTIERAKEYANSPYTAPEIKERLLQAIADVEICNV